MQTLQDAIIGNVSSMLNLEKETQLLPMEEFRTSSINV
mgnify:CR=1 FL=1